MTWQEKLYDFETAMEDGFSALLTRAGLAWVTPRTASKFQHPRARVMVKFSTGQAKQSKQVVAQDSDHLRNASWSGTLTLEIITDSGADSTDSSSDHRAYRAQVRSLMAVAIYDLNEDATYALPYHKVQNIVEDTSQVVINPDQGYEKTTFTYAVDFGIDAGAWAEITS